MREARERWQDAVIAARSAFAVNVQVDEYKLQGVLTGAEMTRLRKKLALVSSAAERLCIGMVKGTVKYEADDWTPDKWIEHLADEAFDLVNYVILHEAATKERGNEAEA